VAKESYVLTVYYSIDRYPKFDLDSVIKGIVGRPEMGAGVLMETKMRDLLFEFKDDKKEAKRALARLKAKKIKAQLVMW
jgi:hypothetical protein